MKQMIMNIIGISIANLVLAILALLVCIIVAFIVDRIKKHKQNHKK